MAGGALPCRLHSPAGPVGLLRGPGWARGIASGRKSSFQGGGVLWGIGRSLSGLEGRSAASSRRTWAREEQRVRPRPGQARMGTGTAPMRPSAACCRVGWSPSSVGPQLPCQNASPAVLLCFPFQGSPPGPRAQAGPQWTCSESCILPLERPPLGLEMCGCLSNDHGHLHLTAPPKGGQSACPQRCLAQGTNNMVGECLWVHRWVDRYKWGREENKERKKVE